MLVQLQPGNVQFCIFEPGFAVPSGVDQAAFEVEQAKMASLKAFKPQAASARPLRRAARLDVRAAAWQKVSTKDSLASTGGKAVVEVGGQKVLLVQDGDQVYAVSNKCSHLGLPLVGKVCLPVLAMLPLERIAFLVWLTVAFCACLLSSDGLFPRTGT